MAKLGFTLGENIGEILLDIAQNKIAEGKGDEALKDFELNFEGFTRDYALQVLKNQVVIKSKGTGITLSDDKADIEKNENSTRPYGPSSAQLDAICQYGKSIGGTLCKGKELVVFDPDKLEYKTVSQICQMDEIALHNFFNSL